MIRKVLLFLFVISGFNLMAQTEPNIVSLGEYHRMLESDAIAAFDAKYKNVKIDSVTDFNYLFALQKFPFIKHLIVNYNISPVTYQCVQQLNASEFVCGVGMKRTKDVSPACMVPKQYQPGELSNEKIELAKICMERGNRPDSFSLEACIYKNELELFKVLETEYSMSNLSAETQGQWISIAISRGYIDFVKYFLDKGFSPDLTEGDDFYLIFRAVSCPEIFFMLVDKGANLNVVGYKQTNVLIHAAREGCIEVIQFLLDKGFNPYEQHGNWTAASMAEEHNQKNKKEVLALFKKYKK